MSRQIKTYVEWIGLANKYDCEVFQIQHGAGGKDLVQAIPRGQVGSIGLWNHTDLCGMFSEPAAVRITTPVPARLQPALMAVRWADISASEGDDNCVRGMIPGWPECGPSYYKLQQWNGIEWLDVEVP